jgi:hypothetical protein
MNQEVQRLARETQGDELAEQVIELTGSRSPLEHRPLPQDDPRQRKPDITLAQEQLGWQPNVQLREGRQGTIAYLEPCWRRIAHDEPRSRALRTSVLQSRPERPRTRPIPAPEGSLA